MKYNAWLLSQHLKGQTRSNSWSDDFSFDDYRTSDVNRSLLGESNRFFYDNLRKSYADLLYCYGLLTQRAQVLKYLSIPPTPLQSGVEFVTECQSCRKTTRGPSCLHCKKYLLYCSLCQLPVRGAANACLACGHAGHTVRIINFFLLILSNWLMICKQAHLLEWFAKYDMCPTCGCKCMEKSASFFDN